MRRTSRHIIRDRLAVDASGRLAFIRCGGCGMFSLLADPLDGDLVNGRRRRPSTASRSVVMHVATVLP